MKLIFDEILAVVRKAGDPKVAFDDLRKIGEAHVKSPVWSAIKTPDIKADIQATALWLRDTIIPYRPTGVYFGLDTLNERNGTGKNVEIGMTTKADPAQLAMDWVWHCERYGNDHLIRGMYEVHKTYQNFGLTSLDSRLADFLFFFGYSGLVLAAALERVPVSWNSLFVWGFHDGDIAFLARGSPKGFHRLAIFDEAL